MKRLLEIIQLCQHIFVKVSIFQSLLLINSGSNLNIFSFFVLAIINLGLQLNPINSPLVYIQVC